MNNTFLGYSILNGAKFADTTSTDFEALYGKYEGVTVPVEAANTILFYYKDPLFGQHVLAYYIKDEYLYQVGVIDKPYKLDASGESYTSINKEGIDRLGEEEVPAENPELADAPEGVKVWTDGKNYWYDRMLNDIDSEEVYVKYVPNAYDITTKEMILEDAPEGSQLAQDNLGKWYYFDAKYNKNVYVKEPKNPEPVPQPENPEPAPKDPEAPKEPEPKPDEPAPNPEPDRPVLTLNGEKVTTINDMVHQWIAELEGKKYVFNEGKNTRVYELIRAFSANEISTDVFFHALSNGVLEKKGHQASGTAIDFLEFKEEVQKLIDKYFTDATPSNAAN